MQGAMGQTSLVSISRFSTLELPAKERFDAWVRDSRCDCKLLDDNPEPFNAESSGVALGPLFLSGRRSLNRKATAAHVVRRTDGLIRTDGQDFFRFSLLSSGRSLFRSTRSSAVRAAGELHFSDAAQFHEYEIRTGGGISLVVPRDFLPGHAANLHGHRLSSGVGRLLGDHLLSLFRNLTDLKEQDVPHVVQSTLQLATAAVSPTAETLREADSPIRNALLGRIQRYIDEHLLEPDLTPDRICRDVGLSRAKLYQLFDGLGGVMRQIQRARLRRVYQVLADLSQPRARIAEIAWRHGFSDEKYFSRLFKAEFGHTPSETLGRAVHSPDTDADDRSAQAGHPAGWVLPWGVPRS
ncbi:helix-turn-helix domain-containing protein [Burkholderia stagnalis]